MKSVTGKLLLSSNVVLSYHGYRMVLAVMDPSTGNAALRWFSAKVKSQCRGQ